MTQHPAVNIGQCSLAGQKSVNQDFHGALVPEGDDLLHKGIVVALADGISTSAVSAQAAEMAVKALMTDYYCTSQAWTVKTSASRVISAMNAWLHAENRRARIGDMDRGFVTTLSALILKGRTAHLFHVGDSRIFRLSGSSLEQLTTDHRVILSEYESCLGRALGLDRDVEIDYRAIELAPGDTFLLATDGVGECVTGKDVTAVLAAHGGDLDAAARALCHIALERGVSDNLTAQFVRAGRIAEESAEKPESGSEMLPLAPLLSEGQEFDGYRILRNLHTNHRSHIWLAEIIGSGEHVVLKLPAVELASEPEFLRRFLLEEWTGRRINSVHVLKVLNRPRKYTYLVTEHVEGQTLAQWMVDNPRASLTDMRAIVSQVVKGLRAFHRMEMVHQDIRPENIMIDRAGTVKLVDFGSVRVGGAEETSAGHDTALPAGAIQYAAPEVLAGHPGTPASDMFSLGVMTYQMLTGHLPYGATLARAAGKAKTPRLAYRALTGWRPDIPDWVDGAIAKAVHPDHWKRYEVLSEFQHDLSHPNPAFGGRAFIPLSKRNPVMFWQVLTLILLFALLAMLARHGI
ncbi:MAG: bifunctional protein-serine/threonine kinase/phosphatase [Notoacmeibacter sp.]|nr:bifunctional protein-serine/threonine kinase/phosphatase [Notoacmeibacter sp.]MCC0032629.1 bifunctional protein-serine/threonine kinase/phosphatase [Brucellaceae bacterium]